MNLGHTKEAQLRIAAAVLAGTISVADLSPVRASSQLHRGQAVERQAVVPKKDELDTPQVMKIGRGK